MIPFNKEIIESGNNANGRYLKFSDGTMICYGNKTFSNLNFNTAYGNVFHAGTQTIDFAQTFANLWSLDLTPIEFGGGIGGLTGKTISNNSSSSFYLWNAVQYTLTVKVGYVAYGTWKY